MENIIKHFTEAELDAIAQKLANEEVLDLYEQYDHLINCSFCRERFELIRDFYFNFNDENISESNTNYEKFAASLIKKNTYKLNPFTPEINFKSIGLSNTYLLAAETASDEIIQQKTFTLCYEPKQILVKIIVDYQQCKSHIFILSDVCENNSFVLLGVTDSDNNFYLLVSDKSGFVANDFSSEFNWNNCNFIIYTPVASYLLNDVQLNHIFLEKEGISFLIQKNEEFINLLIEKSLEKITKCLFIFSDDSFIIENSFDNKFKIQLDKNKFLKEIKFFN